MPVRAAEVLRLCGVSRLTEAYRPFTQFSIHNTCVARATAPAVSAQSAAQFAAQAVTVSTAPVTAVPPAVSSALAVATAPRCAVCWGPMLGLYVWCGGCMHGGHLHHMAEWLASWRSEAGGAGGGGGPAPAAATVGFDAAVPAAVDVLGAPRVRGAVSCGVFAPVHAHPHGPGVGVT